MPGAPFIYYGDEIGMRYVEGLTSVEGGYERTGARSPMQWDGGVNAGFSAAPTDKIYIQQDPASDRPTVAGQLGDGESLLNQVRRLIKLRQAHSALQSRSGITFVSDGAPKQPLAYKRENDEETLLVAINPYREEVSFRLDGTLGGAGHSSHICERLSATGRLIGIDQDEAAIAAAGKRLEPFQNQVTIIRSNYCDMVPRLAEIGVTGVDGILLDLGVSSYQLDNAERGFTYREDVPLDMRMDQRNALSAYEVVNDYSEENLSRILHEYGEERFARKIAHNICVSRQQAPIRTTGELI